MSVYPTENAFCRSKSQEYFPENIEHKNEIFAKQKEIHNSKNLKNKNPLLRIDSLLYKIGLCKKSQEELFKID